jgi:pimeloyl-ACP methyl ester carboxylesterase
MPHHNLQLVLIPGLGADERLLTPQREAFPDLIVPPWLPLKKTDGLPEYAARLAETLPRDKPMIVGGVSLGGMIACELARELSPLSCNENGTAPLVKGVVLIASCPTRSGIRPFFRIAGKLWSIIPPGIFHLAKFLAYPVWSCLNPVPAADQKTLLAMFRKQDNRFMHWAVAAILRWHPKPLEHIPVYHIHGDRDLVLPARFISPTQLIPDGGHLINVTHASEVNAFLKEIILSEK